MIEPKPRTSNNIFWIVGGVLILLMIGCVLTAAVGMLLISPFRAERSTLRRAPAESANVRQLAQATPQALVVVATPEGGVDYESAVLMNIYEQVNPSVVNVTNFALGGSLDRLPGTFHEDDLLPLSGGSGFVWDVEGHIVTNHHVVEGADQLQVTFSDGTMAVADVIGVDPSSDLAVLNIAPEGYNLTPVRRGDLDAVRVGMRVAAIGNPFGMEGTLTSGIVSAVGRSIPAVSRFSIPNSIQTDAPINPGNSGGPLLNEQGEVIGVNAQIRSETGVNSGVGFAIPITIVERVVPALIADGKYEHSYLGVSGLTLSPVCAEDLALSKDVRGAYIQQVLPRTPAADSGLRAGDEPSNTRYVQICPEQRGGDVITAINDQPITSFDEILVYLESYTTPGDTVTLRVLREDEEYLIDVTLEPRPDEVEP
jgi:2-alkenal reductase